MNRPEPKMGDPLIDRGYRTVIDRFNDDDGTVLRSGVTVCISEFVKNEDGVWVREAETIPGAPELERPVPEDAPEQLSQAADRLRREPLRHMREEKLSLLLAECMSVQARLGALSLEHLNRIGGPELIRLARCINES